MSRTSRKPDSQLPLSALLSQLLVAFTVEFDNEFERRMSEAGHPGERLSLLVWSNLMRIVPENGVSVQELVARSLAVPERIRHELGCLERWGFVALEPGPDRLPKNPRARPGPARARRDGWGSGRGIRADGLVRPSPKGLVAQGIWPPLFG